GVCRRRQRVGGTQARVCVDQRPRHGRPASRRRGLRARRRGRRGTRGSSTHTGGSMSEDGGARADRPGAGVPQGTGDMSAWRLLRQLDDVGVDSRRGGYSRHVFDPAEVQLRDWFRQAATRRGLDVETDRNGNLWAWWSGPGRNAIVTGSHLDSVPGGGAFDGPLGVVSAFDAVDRLRAKGVVPTRPVALVAFAEEEGGRF